MRALWNTLESLDRAVFTLSEKVEKARGKATFRKRAEESVEDIRPPQKAIQFDA